MWKNSCEVKNVILSFAIEAGTIKQQTTRMLDLGNGAAFPFLNIGRDSYIVSAVSEIAVWSSVLWSRLKRRVMFFCILESRMMCQPYLLMPMC